MNGLRVFSMVYLVLVIGSMSISTRSDVHLISNSHAILSVLIVYLNILVMVFLLSKRSFIFLISLVTDC